MFLKDPSGHQPLIGSHSFSRFLSEGCWCRAEVGFCGLEPWRQITVGGNALHDKCVGLAICVILLFNRTNMYGSLWLSSWAAVWLVSHHGCWRAWSHVNLFSGSFSIRQLMKCLAAKGIEKINATSSWEHVLYSSTEKDFFCNALLYSSCNSFKIFQKNAPGISCHLVVIVEKIDPMIRSTQIAVSLF